MEMHPNMQRVQGPLSCSPVRSSLLDGVHTFLRRSHFGKGIYYPSSSLVFTSRIQGKTPIFAKAVYLSGGSQTMNHWGFVRTDSWALGWGQKYLFFQQVPKWCWYCLSGDSPLRTTDQQKVTICKPALKSSSWAPCCSGFSIFGEERQVALFPTMHA